MSIKPIDYQLSIPRAMEISKTKSDEISKDSSQHQNQAAAIQHQGDNNVKQVQKREKAEEARIKEKEEKEEKSKEKRESEDSDNKKKNESFQKNEKTEKVSTFDVKI